jgi:hypothetical protein
MKTGLKDMGCEAVEWTKLARHGEKYRAVVKTAMNLWIPQSLGSFNSSENISLSRRTLMRVGSSLI